MNQREIRGGASPHEVDPSLEHAPAFEGLVVVVDDDPQVRNALALWLRAKGFTTRTFASAQHLLESLQPETAAVIVADVRMPGMDGISLLTALRAAGCEQPVVLMTGYADVPIAVSAMKAGAAEFLEKPLTPDALVATVLKCERRMTAAFDNHQQRTSVRRRLDALSHREHEVLDLLVDGLSNKEIAAKLQISPRTVEIHRAHVMSKLKADSLVDLVKLALPVRQN